MRYEPRFYERAAQHYLASLMNHPIAINVRWGLQGRLYERPEIDALMSDSGRVCAVEIKAHDLSEADVEEITNHYRKLGFKNLILISPGISKRGATTVIATAAPRTEFLLYEPDTDAISDWYAGNWDGDVPGWTTESLATGRHHLRFILTRPVGAKRFVVGQQRSRVYSVAKISRLIGCLPSPPAKVLWTPQKFSIPRDVIARGSRLTPLGGFLPIDIDGDALHQASYACQISRTSTICDSCTRHAMAEVQNLAAQTTFAPVDVLSSGGRGVHVYFSDKPGRKEHILALSATRKIRVDLNVTTSLRSTVALPGSLHSATMHVVRSTQLAPTSAECKC